MRALAAGLLVALAGCQSNPVAEANRACHYYGWDTPQCGYAQQQAAAQRAYSQSLIQQGLAQMPSSQAPRSVICQPFAGGISCN